MRSSWCILDCFVKQDKVHQDDLIGANYPLVKEFLIDLGGEPMPAVADFQVLLLQVFTRQ